MMQNKPKVIIITGSIGTGKSTAVNVIKALGFQVLDSDKIVHDGYDVGKELYINVLNYFGHNILNEDKTINRQKLGQIVFNDDEELKKLNSTVHTYVFKEIKKGVDRCNDKVIFLDIPLALEEREGLIGKLLKYDEIWLVYTSSKIQRERLSLRAIKENKNPNEVLKIINKQIPIEEKLKMVDEIINNEGTLEELQKNIEELLKRKKLL